MDTSSSHVKFRLVEEIIALSESDEWQEAKQEWRLAGVYLSDSPDVCLCGHSPIKELCILENRLNGNEAIVGNVCVSKFLEIEGTDNVFQALRRVAADPTRSLNAQAIDQACESGWINDWERGFYLDTLRKRKLSPKQRAKRVEINNAILQRAMG